MVKDQTGWCSLGVFIFLTAAVEETGAHPAHAKPVNYPFVVGFERFHSGMDDEEYLARGGLILLNELNCVACHAPPPDLTAQLPGMIATELTGVANRLEPLDLEIMIRNPRFAKRDTIMPSLFAGPDRDLDEVNALKHYLAAMTDEIPDYGIGDIEKGRSLYHRIGCVACHAPELGYRPPGLPENAEIELAGLPSVPMNLADLYDLDSLTHFLLYPNEHRPSGRMPDFKLSRAEASDLAAYLKAGPDLVLPDNVTHALTQSMEFELDPALAEKGRELFQKKNCSACHEAPGGKGERTRHRARPLAELRTDSSGGCFSERPVGGAVPFYGLDQVQKRAIAATLQRLSSFGALDLNGEIDWRMKQLNCYACHERGGIGGPEVSREVYFGFADEKALALGRWGNLPPALDHVGAKLTPDWLGRILYGAKGGGSVRPYLDARMPVFRKADVEPFFTRFPKADVREQQGGSKLTALLNHGTEEAGKIYFLEGEGACIRCHDAGTEKSTVMPGINLAGSAARLQRTFFDQIILDPQSLQPGTLMPDPVGLDEQGQTIDSLWKWLKSLEP